MDTVLQDLKYAVRQLRTSPGFAAVAILTLAIGIGANTAAFSVLHAVLLRPLPFPASGDLVWAGQRAEHGTLFETSYLDYREIRDASRSFSDLAAVGNVQRFVHDVEDATTLVRGAAVTGDLFDVLAVDALVGRRLSRDDGVQGAERVVVLGHGFWQRRFGGDPSVVGNPIRLDARDYTVVGVMPPDFEYPNQAELWAPVEQAASEWVERDAGFLQLVGRLAPGVTREAARQEVTGLIQRIHERRGSPIAHPTAVIEPLRDELVGAVRPALLLLLAGAGLLLLIASANVASMLLAKGTTRRRETALRVALGASRTRLLRQFLAESLVLAGLGAAVGVALCTFAMEPLIRLTPVDLYRAESIGIVPEVLGFTAAVSVLTAVVFGIAPALRGHRTDACGALASGAGRVTTVRGDRRLIDGLVVVEVALAFTLLVGAGLLVRGFAELQSVDLGFERTGRITFDVFVPSDDDEDRRGNVAFFEELTPRLRSLPGVVDAAGVLLRALDGPAAHEAIFTVEGQTVGEQARNPFMHYQVVTPGYFRAMGIQLVAGRDFDDRDRADAPAVIVVSRALADRFWPGEDPVGRRLKLGDPESTAPWLTIVGVTGAVRYRDLEEPSLTAYLPHHQTSARLDHLVVRTEGDQAAVVAAVREEIRAVEPNARAADAVTMSKLMDGFLAQPRFQTTLLGLFGILALMLGAVGTYGVLAFAVGQRRREFAVRLAVGASSWNLLTHVIRGAALLSLAGIGIGLLGTMLATRVLEGRLSGASELEPAVYGGVAALLVATGTLAALIPARRAARSDPMVAIREE